MPFDIDFAREEDIPQIVALSYRSFHENHIADLGAQADYNKVLLFIANAVLNEVVFVKRNEQDQRVIDGICGMIKGEIWGLNNTFLNTFMFYIKEEHRSFKLAKSFLNACKEYAIIKKLPIVFDIFAQKDVNKKKNLLKYLGFKDFGSSFVFLV